VKIVAFEVTLPDLGEGIEEATISRWRVSEGERVQKDAEFVEMIHDNTIYNIPCPISGVMIEKLLDDGDVVEVGEAIAIIEEE
jgi:pyruvate/2-oxoglutarate dehydrogenase complex dihydrolipoamide acyltransferase (E2) component